MTLLSRQRPNHDRISGLVFETVLCGVVVDPLIEVGDDASPVAPALDGDIRKRASPKKKLHPLRRPAMHVNGGVMDSDQKRRRNEEPASGVKHGSDVHQSALGIDQVLENLLRENDVVSAANVFTDVEVGVVEFGETLPATIFPEAAGDFGSRHRGAVHLGDKCRRSVVHDLPSPMLHLEARDLLLGGLFLHLPNDGVAVMPEFIERNAMAEALVPGEKLRFGKLAKALHLFGEVEGFHGANGSAVNSLNKCGASERTKG